jgi:CubicO group peptidase (beta-lactamase class C family)
MSVRQAQAPVPPEIGTDVTHGTEDFPRTVAVLREGQGRLHHGAQVYVSLDGRGWADFAVGENRPGEPLTPDHLMLWLSAGKPITAAAVLRLWELGRLTLDDAVADHLPEFAAHGKDDVTLRHLLTHTAPLRQVPTGWPEATWEETIAAICAAEPEADWPSGRRAGYHPASGWFLLGEIVRRLGGGSFEEVVHRLIFEPAGMTDCRFTWTGADARRLQERGGVIYERGQGGALAALPWHEGLHVERVSPGASLRGPARDLGRFYEALLAGREGQGVLSPQTIEAMTAAHRRGMFDETLRHTVDFGLGVIVDSKVYGAETVPYGYGRHASPRAFGHGGSQSSVGFADPQHGLVAVVITNGRPGEPRHQDRNRAVTTAIYEDLGLAGK